MALDRFCHHSLGNKSLPHLAQPRCSLDLTPVLTRSILRTTPKNLGSRRSAWPNHSVKADWVCLFGPDVTFASQDEMLILFRDPSQRVIRINQTPIFARAAIVRIRPECLGKVADRKVDPLTLTAVQILFTKLEYCRPKIRTWLIAYPVLVVSRKRIVAQCRSVRHRLITQPRLYDHI